MWFKNLQQPLLYTKFPLIYSPVDELTNAAFRSGTQTNIFFLYCLFKSHFYFFDTRWRRWISRTCFLHFFRSKYHTVELSVGEYRGIDRSFSHFSPLDAICSLSSTSKHAKSVFLNSGGGTEADQPFFRLFRHLGRFHSAFLNGGSALFFKYSIADSGFLHFQSFSIHIYKYKHYK